MRLKKIQRINRFLKIESSHLLLVYKDTEQVIIWKLICKGMAI